MWCTATDLLQSAIVLDTTFFQGKIQDCLGGCSDFRRGGGITETNNLQKLDPAQYYDLSGE